MSGSRRLRLAVVLGALLVLHGVGAAENSFVRGDHIAGSLKAESPMVVAMSSCMRDPKSVDRSRKDIY